MSGFKKRLVPWLAQGLSQVTNGSLRLKVKNEERIKEINEAGKSVIFAFWHGHLWLPVYHFKGQGYVGLASRSRDGEYISRVLKKFGWEVVRGSTSKGGARSLLQLIKKLRQGKNIAITPDGPRGPRHEAKAGIVYLAQKTDSVIIPSGVAFSNKKVFDSWDKFNLPYPFSKAALVYGSKIEVDEDLTDERLNYYQQLIQNQINQATKVANKIIGDN